jgi:L-amino acid N-acyltransferase YncA
MTIQKMTPQDWPAVAAIYLEGIRTGNATFQTEAPGWEAWDKAHLPDCRLVAVVGDTIAGWAALSPVSTRNVYAGVAEESVYIGENFRGQGIGQALLEELVLESEALGFWTLQAGIFPENLSSLRLHEKCGFRVFGRRERIGQMGGVWRDTLLLERRSGVVGV